MAKPRVAGRTSQSVPAPGISHGETAPALTTADRSGSGEEAAQCQEHQELPSCPQPGGAQPTSGRVRRGRRSCRSSPISMEEGPSPCPCPSLASRARLEFWCFRGLTSQQVQKLRSGRCPAQHTLCNIRADGQCLKVSLLEKRQIKGSRNHRTN